jgi:predicted lipoprotein with Yx(FWY)xxD motif
MRKYVLGGLVAGLAMVTTACGGGESPSATALAESFVANSSKAAAGQNVAVKLGDSPVGKILVGPDGRALYGFTNDIDGQSTCVGTCADAWPPLVVNEEWIVGPNLDSGVFSTVAREDGTQQLVAGKWPLYYFSGDASPSDFKGQGSGDVWFLVGPDAKLIKTPLPGTPDAAGAAGAAGAANPGGASAAPSAPAAQPAATVSVGKTPLGDVLVDAEGRTLYAFKKDAEGKPTCTADCADAWPAAKVDGQVVPDQNLNAATFSLVPAVDGGQQLKAGKWPLYRFAGDSKAGDVNGHGSGGVWFVVGPDGKLFEGGSAPAPAPAPASSGKSSGGTGY